MNRPLLFVIIFFVTSSVVEKCFAQSRSIDSLKAILKTAKQDKKRVNDLNELASEYLNYNSDTTVILAKQTLVLSQRIEYKLGEAIAELNIANANYAKSLSKEAILHYNNALSLIEKINSKESNEELVKLKRIRQRSFTGIGNTYYSLNNFEKALDFYLKSLGVAEEMDDKKASGRILNNIANIYSIEADYPKAIEYYLKGLKLSEQVRDTYMITKTLTNLATVYTKEGDYPKALEYYLNALKIAEKVGDKRQMGVALGNLANVYYLLDDYSKSFDLNLKGLKYSEETGDKENAASVSVHIANVYYSQVDYENAVKWYSKGYKLAKEIGYKRVVSSSLGSMGSVYVNRSEFMKALDCYLEALKVQEEIGDKQAIETSLANLGILYVELAKYKEAESNLKKALKIAIEIGAEDDEKFIHEIFSNLYEKTNRPVLALEHYKKYIALRDTIFSQENSKKLMRTEMDHEYEKKKAVADAEHKVQIENQKIVAAEKEKKQNIVIASVGGGLLLVIIFAGFIFRSLRITSKQKLIIEQKNAETEHQKREIEEKQKEILDSIHYSKRIQLAQIPTEKRVSQILNRLKGHEGK